jgi:hypothetical protein
MPMIQFPSLESALDRFALAASGIALSGGFGASAGPGADFLAPYGLENFTDHFIEALDTLLLASAHADAGEWAEADVLLDALWARYPVGDPAWAQLPTRPFGLNIGSPPCYYALRMTSDLADHRLANPESPEPPRTAMLTVLVVGRSSGIQPRNWQELNDGTGVFVTNEVETDLLSDDGRMISESLELFGDYVEVVTKGRLGMEVRVVSLPDVELAAHASAAPVRYAGLVDPSDVFEHVPGDIATSTDWYWLLYPSHVPEQYPDFTNNEFITGGMGQAPHGGPFFIIDDRWLTRKPPHLGNGEYTPIERSAYLPQWLQHEFFHHLYHRWPGFGLEDQPHQWFDRGTWPGDFVGRYEPDYYHESLFRRIHDASPQPHVALRYATGDAPYDHLTPADVLGTHYRVPSPNGWHVGEIEPAGSNFRWRNSAGVSWGLSDDLANGRLLTGPDNPYAGNPGAASFQIVLEREPEFGDLTTDVRGFRFLGELYQCRCARADFAPPSRTLNFFDVAAFIAAVNDGTATADFVEPFGVINLFDIAAFLQAFNAGCP